MARSTASWIFETSRFLTRKQVLVVLLILLLTPTALMHLFLWRIEHRLDFKIHRRPLVSFVPGFISLEDLSATWRGRLKIDSGVLLVRYPLSALLSSRIPVAFKGEEVSVQFDVEFEKLAGIREVVFDRIEARVIIGSKHSRRSVEIDYLDAESKTIQFHLGRKKEG